MMEKQHFPDNPRIVRVKPIVRCCLELPSVLHALSWIVLVIRLSGPYASAQSRNTGSIAGSVFDADTHTPLVGASVGLVGTPRGTTTDTAGRFLLVNVPVGTHAIRVTYIGYATSVITGIVVRSGRIAEPEIMLKPASIRHNEIVVEGGLFGGGREPSTHSLSLGAEEIRREVGTGGDLSRILNAFPSIAKGNDTRNDLVVRGGSPIENAFFVDGIEIPNINHYPQFGASGGAIGLLNVDAIRDVSFSAGGFPACYGDRLSSVTDIALRKGSTTTTNFQVDLHFSGVGFQGEGPLPGLEGSWFVSARRSYLDVLLRVFSSEELSAMPVYGDVHAKIVIDLPGANEVSILEILSTDASSSTREDAEQTGEPSFGRLNTVQNTAGVGWKKVWGNAAYTSLTLAGTSTSYDQGYRSTVSGETLMENTTRECEWKLRSVNVIRAGETLTLEGGFDARWARVDLDAEYAGDIVRIGDPSPSISLAGVFAEFRGGVFAQSRWRVIEGWSLIPSVRFDYEEMTGRTEVSPRLSLRWEPSPVSLLSLSGGVYRQALPVILTHQHEANRFLASPRATHIVAGFSHMFAPDTRFMIEVYDKRYANLPMDPARPSLCVLDELSLTMDYFIGHGPLVSHGRGYSRGIEMSIQKKTVQGMFGTVSASLSRSRYLGLDGAWRDRSYDNRFSFAIIGGYAPGREWEFGVRWLYADGAPFTPFDEAASRAAGAGVLDGGRVNACRLPDYHSLNIRADKRFFFRRSTLTLFLAIWNVYARKNVPFYRWNIVSERTETPNLWSNNPLPVFGIEYEF
ncbi:MAG: TonB-dependent receptor [Bacteroidota bacterium]|nr:TonB-dependent receptor [Bacteroidota bacterium]